jgi:predicted dehydrogenase
LKSINVGFIGVGGIAKIHHLKSLEKISGVNIQAVSDINEKNLSEVTNSYECNGYNDYHEMLEKENLGAVFICLPPFAHTDEVELCAKKGLHIFIEKPIALNLKEAKAMVDIIEQSGVKSQVGFNQRLFDSVQKMRKLINTKKAGKQGIIQARYYANSLHSPWWREKNKSGGQLTEQAIHTVDLCRYIFGDVKKVYCNMNTLFYNDVENFTSEDMCVVNMEFKNGAFASLTVTNGAIPNNWISDMWVVTENVTAFLDLSVKGECKDKFYYINKQSQDEKDYVLEKIVTNKDTHFEIVADFIDAIKNNRAPVAPIDTGYKALEISLAASQSAESCREIIL